jgi:hypothetical protein
MRTVVLLLLRGLMPGALLSTMLFSTMLLSSAALLGACEPAKHQRGGIAEAVEASPQVRVWRGEWHVTDFSRATVPLSEIISGGPPRDGIPPIDEPAFVPVAEAATWLASDEPVLVYRRDGDARAYPLQILIWHEIVNDVVGGQPVAVTYCPLCNSALVFDRTVGGRVLDFGTTGKLRHSDLVMWDRQTESWWQQLTGEAIVGRHSGTRLTFLPSQMVAFRTFAAAFPQGRVLSRETGHSRPYGTNPYRGYDAPENAQPFLLQDRADPRLPAMERVVALELGGEARAYPYGVLAAYGGVANDSLGGQPLVVFLEQETRSVLDHAQIAQARAVGSGVVYDPRVDGRRLTFQATAAGWRDKETGSLWDAFGRARAGALAGSLLTPRNHDNSFAFAWLVFRPDSDIWRGP